MFQNITKTVAITNKSNAMEAETIKNAVSPKNHRSRGNILLISVLVFVFFVLSIVAKAQQWNDIGDHSGLTCYTNNVSAILNNGTLTISDGGGASCGYMADFYATTTWNGRAPWYNQRSSIHTVIINNGVRNVGDGAFEGCNNLTSVTIPNSVERIGITSFKNCTSLTYLNLPNSVKEIEGGAFYGCNNLTIDYRRCCDPSILYNHPEYTHGTNPPFNNMTNSKVRVLPWLLSTFPNGTCPKEIINDGNLVTPTYTAQNKSVSLPSTYVSCGLSHCDDYKVYKLPLTQGVIYDFNTTQGTSYASPRGLYNSSGTELTPTYWYGNWQSNITTNDAYLVIGGFNNPSLTLEYRCWLSAPTISNPTQNGTSINISWDIVEAATSYKIFRSNSSYGTYSLLGTSTTANYTDDNPLSGYNYYKVEAHRSANPTTQSDLSSYKSIYYTAPPNLTVSPTAHTFPASSNLSTTINVTSNVSWTVTKSSGATWLTISPTSGSNNGSFTMTATANTSSQRTATVTVSGGGIQKTIEVTQMSNTPSLDVSPLAYSFFASGGTSTNITVTSNVSWTATKSSGASWLTVSPTSGSNNGSFTMTATANSSTSPRSAYVTVSGGNITKTVIVTQDPYISEASLSVSPEAYDFTSGSGASSNINVYSNQSWTVSVSPNATSWLSTSLTNGSNNGHFTMSVSANNASYQRSAIVTVSGGGISRTISVTQDGNVPNAVLNISPTIYNFAATSGSTSITLTSNQSWSVSNSASWLTVSPSSGSNNRNLNMTATANSSPSSRSAIVTVTGGEMTRTICVTQSAYDVNVGIAENTISDIEIYPNPTDGILRIESKECKINNVEICDLAGRVVFGQPQGSLLQINVSHLSAGIYLVKIHTDKGIVTRKAVKN